MFIIVFTIDFDPLTRQFFVSLVVSLLLFRIFWVFESQHIYNLLAGYELDRALILRKSEKNIFEILGLKKLTNKILAIDQDENNTLSMTSTEKIPGVGYDPMMKGLEKFAKLKNQDELLGEITRIKEEMKLRQIEIACLENMMFASDKDGSSSKSGSKGKSNDHRYSYDSGNAMNHFHNVDDDKGNDAGARDTGDGGNILDLEKASNNSPLTITGKIHFNGPSLPGIDDTETSNKQFKNDEHVHQSENEE